MASDLFDLSGKVALVTGASRGLGWAMAQSLAEQGAHVLLNARDAAALEARVGEHSGVTWKLVNCTPPAASASMWGVSISEP